MVSVLILTYNQEDTIQQTLESVEDQITTFSYEIIIGDDASKDATRLKCSEFISKSKANFRLLPSFPNVGLIENYKRLIKVSNGKYIACCAGDDYWTDKYKLQKQVNFLENNPDFGLIHTNYKIYNEKNNSFEECSFQRSNGYIFKNLLLFNEIGALTTLVRRDLILEAIREGIYKHGFLMEDYPLWLFISKKCKVAYINDITAVWRKAEESVSNSKNLIQNFLFEESVVNIRKHFAEKYNCLDLINDDLIKKYRYNLSFAFNHQLKISGKNAFFFLQKYNKIKIKDYLLYFGSQFYIFAKSYNLIKKIVKLI